VNTKLRLVLFGPPGAGKGTQAQLLKAQVGVPHISSGDIFRHQIQERTYLGQLVAQYIEQGLLVPDETTIEITLQKILSLPSEEGFLLDGFPRNRNQAAALAKALALRSQKLDRVIYIDVSQAELIRRLAKRSLCNQCQAPHTLSQSNSEKSIKCQHCGGKLYQRPDDKPAAVRQRIQVYQKETIPTLDFYREHGLLMAVSGLGSISEVNQRVLSGLGSETVRISV
jgi:adenylate kinase